MPGGWSPEGPIHLRSLGGEPMTVLKAVGRFFALRQDHSWRCSIPTAVLFLFCPVLSGTASLDGLRA